MLSEEEIKYLIEKAESSLNLKRYDEALRYYDQLSQDDPTNPHYYKRMADIYLDKKDTDTAIILINTAIWWGPDDSYSYQLRGACYAQKLNFQRDITEKEKKEMTEKIVTNYKASLEKDPTLESTWLAILERYFVSHNWDDAISVYGTCKPYIQSKEYQLVRAWLGCLSLIFAGDPIEDEDKQPIFDNKIHFKGHCWNITEIENLLIELEHQGESQKKLRRANEYHQKFLSHFDEEPLRDIPS